MLTTAFLGTPTHHSPLPEARLPCMTPTLEADPTQTVGGVDLRGKASGQSPWTTSPQSPGSPWQSGSTGKLRTHRSLLELVSAPLLRPVVTTLAAWVGGPALPPSTQHSWSLGHRSQLLVAPTLPGSSLLHTAPESLGRSRHAVGSDPAQTQGQCCGQQGPWPLLDGQEMRGENLALRLHRQPGFMPPRGL